MPSPAVIRASDQDRQQVADRLGQHLASGRLGLSEFDDRVAAAYASTTLGDLDALLTDLPAADLPAAPHPFERHTAGGRPDSRSTAAMLDEARRRSGPWASWLLTGVICMVIWATMSLAQGRPLSFWPGWVIGPWGAVLLGRHLVEPRLRS